MVRPKGITLYLKTFRDIINVVKSSLSGSIFNLLKAAIISNLVKYLHPATRVPGKDFINKRDRIPVSFGNSVKTPVINIKSKISIRLKSKQD